VTPFRPSTLGAEGYRRYPRVSCQEAARQTRPPNGIGQLYRARPLCILTRSVSEAAKPLSRLRFGLVGDVSLPAARRFAQGGDRLATVIACPQAGPMVFPLGEIVNVLLPPSDPPTELATAVLTARTPPFGNECLPAKLTVAVLLEVS
jgi:hypothetical protein